MNKKWILFSFAFIIFSCEFQDSKKDIHKVLVNEQDVSKEHNFHEGVRKVIAKKVEKINGNNLSDTSIMILREFNKQMNSYEHFLNTPCHGTVWKEYVSFIKKYNSFIQFVNFREDIKLFEINDDMKSCLGYEAYLGMGIYYIKKNHEDYIEKVIQPAPLGLQPCVM
jgi:hypothetical protein